MAILSKGTTFTSGQQVTSANLNDLVDSATFIPGSSGTTDDTSLQVNGNGRLAVKDGGITNAKLAANSVTTEKIANGTILDEDISASAAISLSKLASVTAGRIVMGNSGNVATATTMSGDATISSSGALTIASGAITSSKIADGTIVNADIGASAAIALSKLASVTAGQIVMGNASNVATATTLSGDATISSSGVLTIANGAVTSSKIADGAITPAKLTTGAPTWNGTDTITVTFSDVSTILLVENSSTSTSKNPQLRVDNYSGSTTGSPVTQMRNARGSKASPTALQTNDTLGQIVFSGYNGTSFVQAGRITVNAGQNFTGSNNGTIMRFVTCVNGETESERMRFSESGCLLIGTTTDVPSALLAISSTTKGFRPPSMTTTQRNAISAPDEGIVIYNNTTKKLNFYNGTGWEAVTSS